MRQWCIFAYRLLTRSLFYRSLKSVYFLSYEEVYASRLRLSIVKLVFKA